MYKYTLYTLFIHDLYIIYTYIMYKSTQDVYMNLFLYLDVDICVNLHRTYLHR